MSSCALAVLQFGARWPGVGDGAGVGGDAGADGSRLPGITLGLAGMGIGIAAAAAAAAEDEDVDCCCSFRPSVRGMLVTLALDGRWA